jgi:hypothetical protein
MTSTGGIPSVGFLRHCPRTTNFDLVIMDTGLFVKAFAAPPKAVLPGCVIGRIAYFAIPWALGTLMSSVARGHSGSTNLANISESHIHAAWIVVWPYHRIRQYGLTVYRTARFLDVWPYRITVGRISIRPYSTAVIR